MNHICNYIPISTFIQVTLGMQVHIPILICSLKLPREAKQIPNWFPWMKTLVNACLKEQSCWRFVCHSCLAGSSWLVLVLGDVGWSFLDVFLFRVVRYRQSIRHDPPPPPHHHHHHPHPHPPHPHHHHHPHPHPHPHHHPLLMMYSQLPIH